MESRVPAARRLHGKMSQVYAEAKQSLAVARHRQQQQTDRHRKDTSLLYPVGGKALLSTKDINLRLEACLLVGQRSSCHDMLVPSISWSALALWPTVASSQ